MDFDDMGLNEFEDLLKGYIEKVDDPTEVLSIGALSFVDDLLRLPKPMSDIRSAGYTHLIDTFGCRLSPYSNHKNEIEVGWGKRYGNVLEWGSHKMKEQPHLNPTFMKNSTKYYKKMINYFHGG